MKKILLCLCLAVALSFSAAAQKRVVLNIERTVQMATDSSLQVRRYRSDFAASRFRYLSWEASRRPQILFSSTPVMYEQYMTRRYLSNENVDVYRQQKLFYTEVGLTFSQTLEPLGGQFYGATQLGYLRAFGDTRQQQWMTVPVSLGYRQDLLFYNPLKWDRRIEPLKLTRAEKELAYHIESTSVEAVEKFFALALAQDQLQMAEEYLASCDTIYAIARQRYKISSISKAELSILELASTNARTTLSNARITHSRTVRDLATLLGMAPGTDIELVIPSVARNLHVNLEEALVQARENNPAYVQARQLTLEARRDADKARVEKNFTISLDASVGLNQVANQFAAAYQHPPVKSMANISFSIPLLDWGNRKNLRMAAVSALEAAEQAEEDTARNTERDVTQAVEEFNERQEIVEIASQALAIAEEAYTQSLQLFIRGQSSAYDLSLAQSHWQNARSNQIASLQNYWLAYYRLRRLTLYDFQRRSVICYE